MSDRCTGHCCRAFVMSTSYENIRRAYEAHKAGETTYKHKVQYGGNPGWDALIPEDIEIVFPMLKPLGAGMVNPVTGVPTLTRNTFYTCHHLQDDGNCGIYATRPQMCRDFPYNNGCEFAECTWESARKPAIQGKPLISIAELVNRIRAGEVPE